MTLEKDTILNKRYRVLEILGEGGMGAVYKARDENLGVTVAVKENLFTAEEYSRQFRVEAQILATLRHPNLTRVTDHFEHRDLQYIVMDYIDGEDLRDRLERVATIDEDDVIKIGAALCDALSYLHNLEPIILHRDIKPGNVRISPDGHVFLVDFGLAKIVQGNQMTITGARAMTPGYSPPEQYGTARTDERSDIYSLGASLYSAITGELPEDGLARAMNQSELTPLRTHNPRVSRRLAGVIEKSLAVQPDDRYQTAEDFKAALVRSRGITRRRLTPEEMVLTPPPEPEGDLLAGARAASQKAATGKREDRPSGDPPSGDPPSGDTTTGEPEDSTPRRISPVEPLPIRSDNNGLKRARRRRKRLARSGWVAFILVLALAAGVWFLIPGFSTQALAMFGSPTAVPTATRTPPPEEETPAPTATSQPEPPTATLVSVQSVTATPTVEPTATHTPTDPPTATPTIGPTPIGGGKLIAFASDRSGSTQLWLMDTAGENLVQLTEIDGGACQPDWSPDGTQLVFISPCSSEQEEYPGAALYIINVDGTGLTPLIGSRNGDFDPDWSPDGSQILFTTLRTGSPEVHVFNLSDGSIAPLATQGIKNIDPAWNVDGTYIAFITNREGAFQIWMMKADGSEQVRFSRNNELKNTSPAWSPDGRFVIYDQREQPNGLPYLIRAPLEGDGWSEIRLSLSISPARAPAYSPDGNWVLFEAWPDGENHDIYLIDLSNLTALQLTDGESFEFDPAWSPIQ